MLFIYIADIANIKLQFEPPATGQLWFMADL
jgi:hypothetical protein